MTLSTRNHTHRRSAARTSTWVLHQEGDDYVVIQNGRQLAQGLSDTAAVAYVRKRVARNDRVLLQEPDGYRREITRQI